MKAEDMEKMMFDMEKMSPLQESQMKSMGMDPAMIKTSMQMMQDNPALMKSVGKMMENMTPEMLAQSRAAQEQMENMTSDQMKQAASAVTTMFPRQVENPDKLLTQNSSQKDSSVDEISDEQKANFVEGGAMDPKVIDKFFYVAELMSQPPSGGVTFAAFSSLPPITLLSGDREFDLSKKELKECWTDGSLGATRVDRTGFEQVWKEIQEYFEGDILDEARKTSGINSSQQPTGSSMGASPEQVGENLTREQMELVNQSVKNMSDDDMSNMLGQMGNLSTEQKARMKAMGVDPSMMQKTAKMMKDNPLMQKAASAMIKNLSPEQMRDMSQRAQSQMSGMSKEDYEETLDRFGKDRK